MHRPPSLLASFQPRRLAAEFLERYHTAGHYLRSNIDALATLATGGEEPQMSEATSALFGSLVEPLSDSFDPESIGLYIQLMAQIIQASRKLDVRLNAELSNFGLVTENDLIARAERLRPDSASQAVPSPAARWTEQPNSINRIVVLSRVTIGADVAITSVIVQRLKQKFPQATLTLVGGAKIRETFGADPGIDFAELEYGRRATLMDRLGAWVDLVRIVRYATRELKPDEFLVVDPDSRLTQLGMLPVTPPSNYLFFPSREHMSDSAESLARLASDWSGQILGLREVQLPRVAIGSANMDLARNVIGSLRNSQSRPIVSVNFGVGNNDKKRVGQDFEPAIIDFLLDHNARIVLDRGAGPHESSHTDSLIAKLGSLESSESSESLESSEGSHREMTLLQADEQRLRALCQGGPMHADILVLNCRLGLLAALIAASDLYIGYDSAGQHIAAAAGTPCIDVFAGYSSPRMIDRWRPTGPGNTTIIDAGAGRPVVEITEEVKAAAFEVLKSQQTG
jgi:ADP-heptose:LPS heptosyltransferase